MIQVGDIQIQHNKITTPHGEIPLNSSSTVKVTFAPRNQLSKKAAAAAFFVTAVATGGVGMLLLAPGIGFLLHESYSVIVKTGNWDYSVKRFGGIGDPKSEAFELQKVIASVIAGTY